MSITPGPISIRLPLAAIPASRGRGGRGGGELAGEVVDADERPVDPDLLGGNCELYGLTKCVAARVGQSAAWMPGAEREETDPLRSRHRSTIPTRLTPPRLRPLLHQYTTSAAAHREAAMRPRHADS